MSRLVTLAVLLALVLAACGGSSGSSTQSSSTATRSFAAFSSCLKTHGVSLGGFNGGQPPSGQPPSGGTPPQLSAKTQKAIAACQQYAPRGGPGGFGPPPTS